MELTIAKRELVRLATRAAGITEKKSTMPVLELALLTATKDGRLECSATDLYLSLVDATSAEVTKPGSLAVNPADLATRAKNLPDGPVTLTERDGGLVLRGAGSARRYTMRSLSGDDYPPLPKVSDEAAVMSIEPGVLATLIALTAVSMSTDETRAHLHSMLMEFEPGKARSVTTDGHRLSLAELPIDGGAKASMLIPHKAVLELRKLADATTGETMKLVQQGSHLFVLTETSTFSVKLVDAQFPPYAQVIPTSSAHTFRLPRAALLDAARAILVSADEKTKGIRLSFDKGVLRISSQAVERGEGFDELPYDDVSGNGGALVGLNAQYLIEALTVLDCEEIALGVGGELDPILMRRVGEQIGEYTGVLMPMRLA